MNQSLSSTGQDKQQKHVKRISKGCEVLNCNRTEKKRKGKKKYLLLGCVCVCFSFGLGLDLRLCGVVEKMGEGRFKRKDEK